MLDPATLIQGRLFDGLDHNQVSRLAAIARPRSLGAGECLILLGDYADRLYSVLRGKIELCFPFSFHGTVRDICVESILPDSALGWSALVKPYRFTLSAHAAEVSEVATFLRQDLKEVFDADPHIGYVFMRNMAEIIGSRLLRIQAMWARELQRALAEMAEMEKEDGPHRFNRGVR